MPPKPKFTKEEITNAALTVAREKGIAAVSAREVALVLGTSTRPIFTYFRTMDELKKEVRQFAENIFQNYVEKGLAMDPPFLGVGVQSGRGEPACHRPYFPCAGRGVGRGRICDL